MRMISVSGLALALAMTAPIAAMADSLGQITVTGEASVQVVPDLATVSLGVTTIGATASEALSANSAAVTAIIARLGQAGIEAKDIQTSNLSLNPNYYSSDGSVAPQIQNYMASNMVTVTVRKLDSAGSVLDAAVQDGANTLNGLGFGLTDPRPAQDTARKNAVADARAKATLLAEAAGVHLGAIVSITEGGAAPVPMPMYRMDVAAAPVPVSGGTLDIAASVTVVWALEQ
jgi:uncharacterized protein